MKIDLNYIKEVAAIMEDKALAEVAIEDGEQKLCLKRGEVLKVASNIVDAPVVQVQSQIEAEVSPVITPKKETLTAITSPMVGTFYAASSPDAEAFVKVGDFVQKGQIVCIVEAMKLMNEIESEVSGKIVEICVENGQTIEFGQVLMYVE